VRYRLREPKERPDFNWTIMWVLSSASHTSARPFLEKIPPVVICGCTTIALNVPAGTVTRSRADHVNDDGISFRLEIAIELVGATDLERNGPQKIEE